MKALLVNKRARLALLLGAACGALAACGEQPPLPGDVGAAAPAYAAASLAGDSIRLSGLRGRVVLLNVWATWCIPCRREIPELQALHQQYSGRGLQVLGVSVDEAGSAQDVADFVRDFSMTYDVVRDPGNRISALFRTPGVPSSFLIDRAGVVRWRRVGPFTSTDAEFLKVLQKTL
ncbi:MAG TPA: TlpA disulfide reductase family protein [Longimicrobiales bacterium]